MLVTRKQVTMSCRATTGWRRPTRSRHVLRDPVAHVVCGAARVRQQSRYGHYVAGEAGGVRRQQVARLLVRNADRRVV